MLPSDESVVPEPIPQYHYTVPIRGTGTAADPFRPDLPANASYAVIGQPLHGVVLVVSDVDLVDTTKRKKRLPRQAMEAQAKLRGITYEQALTGWRVG